MRYILFLSVLMFVALGCKRKENPKRPSRKNPKTHTNVNVLTPSHSDANEKRYALVIGNADYEGNGVSPLNNPDNDADLVSTSLQDVQFEVTKITNANRSIMWDAIDKFVEKLSNESNSVGLFYYAGHGLEIGGNNYLLPTDVKVGSGNAESDISRDGYKLQELLTRLENARNRLNMVFLDACRDNPFPKLTRSIGSRGMSTVSTTAEIMVGYSTAAGATAGDGENSMNSPFSAAFAALIKQPKEVGTIYKDITAQVIRTTNSQQRPWSGGSLTREFYFVPQHSTSTSSPTAPSGSK